MFCIESGERKDTEEEIAEMIAKDPAAVSEAFAKLIR